MANDLLDLNDSIENAADWLKNAIDCADACQPEENPRAWAEMAELSEKLEAIRLQLKTIIPAGVRVAIAKEGAALDDMADKADALSY